jgi:hypothetical protein
MHALFRHVRGCPRCGELLPGRVFEDEREDDRRRMFVHVKTGCVGAP